MNDQSEEKYTVKNAAIKYGIMLGLVSIIIALVTFMTGEIRNVAISVISIVLTGVFIFLGHKSFKEHNTYMTFGNGLGIGTLMVFIGGLISAVFSYIYVKFVDPSIIQLMKDMQIEEMLKRDMSQEQIDQAMEMTGFTTTPEFTYSMAIVGSVLIGFVLSLIITIFTKKNDPSLEF